MNMTKKEIEVLKSTMTSLIGNGRDHVNAEWYGITENEMDKIEDQAKEIIDWYLISYLKAEGYVDTDYKEEQEEDTEEAEDHFDAEDVEEEVIEEEIIEETVNTFVGDAVILEEKPDIKGNIVRSVKIVKLSEDTLNITEEDLKKDYEYEKTSGEGHQLADNYHTMSELYFHRMMLFVTILKLAKEKGYELYRSKLHHDGSMFDGYFIVGIFTPEGQYGYHYNLKYWNYFNFVDEWDKGPEWDGSKADDLHRLLSL